MSRRLDGGDDKSGGAGSAGAGAEMNELERALFALGRELEIPEPPDLVPAVSARLERRRPSATRRRVAALAVAFALLAALAATLAIPDARAALLRVLHLGGEEIQLVDELPPVPAQPDLGLVLGQRVTLEEARASAGFHLRELDDRPDGVYLGEHGTVWFLYGTEERVRLLVAQTRLLSVERGLFLKKLAGGRTTVTPVSIDGAAGYFLSGEPHVVLLVDEHGEVVSESARLAHDVLVWSDSGVSYRLEGDFSQRQALRIAQSLR